MKELVFVVEEAQEGGYTAYALGENIFTEGDNLEDIRSQILDAVSCHFDKNSHPDMIRLHFVRDEVLAI